MSSFCFKLPVCRVFMQKICLSDMESGEIFVFTPPRRFMRARESKLRLEISMGVRSSIFAGYEGTAVQQCESSQVLTIPKPRIGGLVSWLPIPTVTYVSEVLTASEGGIRGKTRKERASWREKEKDHECTKGVLFAKRSRHITCVGSCSQWVSKASARFAAKAPSAAAAARCSSRA